MVKKRKYFDAADYARKNFFKVLEPKDRPKKYESLRWTQLEKKIFSSKNLSIETPQQEQITLLIIKNVLGSDTKSWKTFDEMFHAKGSKIKKIHNSLLGSDIIIYESLANLDQLPSVEKFQFFGFPLPFINLEASPVRAVGIL